MKVLMVGLGGIGQRHVRNLRTLRGGDVDIIAYRVRKFSRVLTDTLEVEPHSTLEDKYCVRVFDSLEAALEERPDITMVCNPSSLHMPVALAAAEAGSHLFIEKPLSHSAEGVHELIHLVEGRDLVGMVGYQLRFHPCIRRLQALLANHAIGRVLAVNAEVGEYLPAWHKYEDYRQMYASRADLGGGVVLSQIHEFDYLYSLFGVPIRVFACGGHLSSLEVEVEDVASIIMDFEVEGHRIPVHLHQDYVQRPPSRHCEVIGDAGKILMNLSTLNVQVFDAEGRESENRTFDGLERNQLFLDEMTHFLSCVEEHTEPLVTLRDGANSLRMALAAKESLANGGVVVT